MKETRVGHLTKSMNMNPGASNEAFTELSAATGLMVPEEYLAFMRVSNGAEGFVGEGGYLLLWPIQKLVKHNRDYAVGERAPGLFLFGSDGGGEAYAFDTRRRDMPIVDVPFVGMSLEHVRPCGRSFLEFLQHLSGLHRDD